MTIMMVGLLFAGLAVEKGFDPALLTQISTLADLEEPIEVVDGQKNSG